jgi:hypothetical protein
MGRWDQMLEQRSSAKGMGGKSEERRLGSEWKEEKLGFLTEILMERKWEKRKEGVEIHRHQLLHHPNPPHEEHQ